MGKLKPIGSEKLDGIDKIRRIMEISNYRLNIPNPINENSSDEYKKTLADGNTYHIVKEKTGYVIKKGLFESTAEYIEPIKNRKFYPSYSQALKRLNLITKEINLNEGQIRNISLFNESEQMEYVLDLEEQETAPAPAGPPPSPQPEMPAEPMPAEPEVPAEEPMPEPEMPPMDDEGDEDEDEVVTMKSVQKATGKLAQKIRAFLADEENEMTSEDTKYVINSVLSALDLSSLDDEDLDEIMSKFEGEEGGEEMPEPDMDGEMSPEMPEGGEEMPAPSGEMGTPPPAPEGGEMAEYRTHGARKNRHVQKMEEMIESLFTESKVDKVLSKYFVNESSKKQDKTINRIQNLAESFKQEVKSVKLYEKYGNSKFLGKNKYGHLVFEMDDRRIRISPNGEIL
jgi:hypothetical protein